MNGSFGTNWLHWGALGLVLLSGSLGCEERHSAQSYFDVGGAHVQEGNYDAAIVAFQKGLELEPRSAVGHNLLGMAYRWKYNTLGVTEWKEKEIEAFRRAVACDSLYAPAHINLGATLYYMGRKAEAAPYFERALRIQPQNPERSELERYIREGKKETAAREGGS